MRVSQIILQAAAVHKVAALQGLFGGLQNQSGDSSCTDLKNHGSFYTVEIRTGSAGEKLDVVVDTGSDELVVPSCSETVSFRTGGRCLGDTIPKDAKRVNLEYGSGGISAAVMSGTVHIGSLSVDMHESMLYMYDDTLNLDSQFEGILALGPPHRTEGGRMIRLNGPADNNSGIDDATLAVGAHGATRDDDHGYFYTKSFLEQASISSFSLCFNSGKSGVMRFGNSPSGETLGSIGGIHWGLGLEGITVGSKTATFASCAPGMAAAGSKSTCGAIPDSGTTFMMAPKEQIDEIYEGICDGWSHCSSVDTLESKVESCQNLDSLPPLFFKVTGTGSASTTLEIPASAYVFRDVSSCQLAFDVLEYKTDENGPVFIMGMPLFFSYEVSYGLSANSPTMAFDQHSGCKSCSSSLLRDDSDDGTDTDSDTDTDTDIGTQWYISEERPRKSRVDVTQPL